MEWGDREHSPLATEIGWKLGVSAWAVSYFSYLIVVVFQDLLVSLGTTFSQGSTNEQVGEGPLSFRSLSWRRKIGSEISEGSLRVGLSLFLVKTGK